MGIGEIIYLNAEIEMYRNYPILHSYC